MDQIIQLLISFGINLAVVFVIIQLLYYPKSHRKDYCFTFFLMSVSIFLLIFVLNDVNMKTGFALGLFAIFSIMRYRTDAMPVREMTYLFLIIAISVVNAMIGELNPYVIGGANILLIASIFGTELLRGRSHEMTKLVQYDRIDLIVPDKREEMIEDLTKRTGLKIKNVEIGHIDFLKDSAMLKVYYEGEKGETNSVNHVVKFPKGDNGDDD